jgi:hypothetical protein
LNGRGGETGINAIAVANLVVENCDLNNFTGNAITFDGVELHLRDTDVRNSGSDFASAVYVARGRVMIDRLRMERNRHGLVVDGGNVAIRDSIAVRQFVHALWARGLNSPVNLWIENCAITGTESGSAIIAGDSSGMHDHWVGVNVGNSIATSNAIGISAFPTTASGLANMNVSVSNTTIALNQVGIVHAERAIIRSRGNNTIEGNGDDGSFTAGFPAR